MNRRGNNCYAYNYNIRCGKCMEIEKKLYGFYKFLKLCLDVECQRRKNSCPGDPYKRRILYL